MAAKTKKELRAQGITMIFWPSFSLDLNLIKRV
jgi:hypothetical protein